MSLNEQDLASRIQATLKELECFDEMLTLNQLADRSKLSRRSLQGLLGSGLPHYRMNDRGKILVRWVEFCDFLKRFRRVSGVRPAEALKRRGS